MFPFSSVSLSQLVDSLEKKLENGKIEIENAKDRQNDQLVQVAVELVKLAGTAVLCYFMAKKTVVLLNNILTQNDTQNQDAAKKALAARLKKVKILQTFINHVTIVISLHLRSYTA